MSGFLQSLNLVYLLICFVFVLGILAAWLVYHFRATIFGSVKSFRKQVGNVRETISVGSEANFRNDIYYFAQKQHLAASMFSLDEIAIIPKVLTPLVQATPSVETAPTDSVSLTVPYIPDWPEVSAIYQSSTITLVEALQGGASIILAGHPGSGKTVALAWLASRMARSASDLGVVAGFLPLYVHATDLSHLFSRKDRPSLSTTDETASAYSAEIDQFQRPAKNINDAVEMLIDALSKHTSAITLTRLPGIVRSALESQHALLILDRVDELPADHAQLVTDFLTALKNKYPHLRMVVAMSYDNLAGLPTLGLSLLALASWGDYERGIFLKRWSQLWAKWIYPTEKSQTKNINTYYLKSWLSDNNALLSPLEYTLKVWAAFSGDILGMDGPSAIEAYIRRMTSNVSKARPALEQFAVQLLVGNDIKSNPEDAERVFSVLSVSNQPAINANPSEPEKPIEPSHPSELEKPAEPGQPPESVKPAVSGQPSEPEKPAEPVIPSDSVKPAEPGQSVESEKPTEPDKSAHSNQPAQPVQPATPPPVKIRIIKGLPGIDIMTGNGFMVSHPGSQYGFSHPVIIGYLAGNALSNPIVIKRIQSQPAWIGRTLAMYYLARTGDVTSIIQYLLQEDDIVHTNHLQIARWLQVAPKNRPWRTIILRTLVTVLQKEKNTISLAAKIIAGLALSGDAGVSIYFRQLLKSDNPNLRQLAALGCGIMSEQKAIEDLSMMLSEPSPVMIRSACLALAAIGDKQSLELLATSLLNGNEDLRRYAAEALANNPVEGHPALKDGSTMEDLMVRRSVVFGLIRINQPWATKIVEGMQLEDNEWVVRNAAIQAFDELRRKSSFAPRPLPDLTETPWLVDFAAKNNTTVAPGKPAEDLVLKALANGNPVEKLHAIEYLRAKCDVEFIDKIHAAYISSTDEVRDALYYVLWLMTIAGLKLPTSVKFNL